MIGTVAHLQHELLAVEMCRTQTQCDALIVDAPYSARCHDGHDAGALQTNGGIASERARSDGRRLMAYDPWSATDVQRFVALWAPLTRGWMCSITDHVLAPAWEEEMRAQGRYVFSPIACLEKGSRCRMLGDGPSQWSTFLIVSRQMSGEWLAEWRSRRKALDLACALPGGYIVPKEGKQRIGGKSLRLMRDIVSDYSVPGDVVCDPCAGAGTTLVAAKLEGRRWIGGDADAEHARMAQRWLAGLTPRETAQAELFAMGDAAE